MDEVIVHWSRSWSFHDLYRNPDLWYTRGIYAILTPSPISLLYIGMVYDQRFSTEIAHHLGPLDRSFTVVSRASSVGRWIYNHVTTNPRAKIADIELITGNRISRQLVQDIEAALIMLNQPPANLRSMRRYYGRPVRIHHTGSRKPFEKVDIVE